MNGMDSVEQNICIFSRKRMEFTGIEEVENFTDNSIVMSSKLGSISVEGENLKIESFSMEKGELIVHGQLDGVYYCEEIHSEKRKFLSFLR